MEDTAYHLERLVGVAQSVAVGQIEDLAIELDGLRLLVQDDATFLCQIVIGPDVVVACEVVHLDAHVCQLGYLSKETGEAFGHHIFIFVPEVKHIAQQIDSCCLLLDRVKEAHQSSLLHASVLNGPRAKVGIGKEIDILHN